MHPHFSVYGQRQTCDFNQHYLHTDKGTEEYNKNVATMLSQKGIVHYSTENENIKAGMVERFNRTLHEVMS